MKRLLVDTSGYAAFMRGHDETIAAIREADEIYVTATVLGELLGFMAGSRRAKNEAELERFLNSPRVHLIDVDESTSQRYAVIFASLRPAGTAIPTNDLWIAASAMQYGLELLTHDAHFRRVPQYTAGLRRRPHRPSLFADSFDQQFSTQGTASRILVSVHPGPSCQPVRFESFQTDESRPDGQPASRNNVLAHHS